MEGFLGSAYSWVLAAHIIFVIFWMAGLFTIGRYNVYQRSTEPGSAEERVWTERTGTLRRVIISPAMSVVWILGWTLVFNIGALSMGWFHAKLALVIGLSGYHGWAVSLAKKLARGARPSSDRTLRLMNEVPAIATIAIVVLVVVKPF